MTGRGERGHVATAGAGQAELQDQREDRSRATPAGLLVADAIARGEGEPESGDADDPDEVDEVDDKLRDYSLFATRRSPQIGLRQRWTEFASRSPQREDLDAVGSWAHSSFAYVPDGGTKLYEGKEDLIDALQTGILSRKIVRFSYRDSRCRYRRSP